ncbi:MAG: UPF0175 family protein [Candidatus Nanopusillus sp.]
MSEEKYTYLEKIILILLYLYNDKISIDRLHKIVFLASLDLKGLKEKMSFRPRMYKDIFFDPAVAEALEFLQVNKLIEINNNIVILTKNGEEAAQFLLSELSYKEKDILEEVLDLFNGTTDDEILAIFYFKLDDILKIIKPLYRIIKNRKKLAVSLYRKGKISIGAASEIAGMNIKDFMHLLHKI